VPGDELISVVVAVHAGDDNAALRAALESLVAQSYPHVEVLVVVDGAVDSAKSSILDEFVRRDHWRVLYLPRNRGPSAARNAGIAAASGVYVAIMDADDVSHPDRLLLQKAHLQREALDVVSSPAWVIDEHDQIIGVRALPSSSADVHGWAPYGCPLNNPAVLARTSILQAAPYNERYRVSEDYDLWVRLLLSGHRLGNTVEKTLYYRQPEWSMAKRRGARYAWIELRVKLSASRLLPWYRRPAAWLLACTGACARLLPGRFFTWLYRTKAERHDRAFRDCKHDVLVERGSGRTDSMK